MFVLELILLSSPDLLQRAQNEHVLNMGIKYLHFFAPYRDAYLHYLCLFSLARGSTMFAATITLNFTKFNTILLILLLNFCEFFIILPYMANHSKDTYFKAPFDLTVRETFKYVIIFANNTKQDAFSQFYFK